MMSVIVPAFTASVWVALQRFPHAGEMDPFAEVSLCKHRDSALRIERSLRSDLALALARVFATLRALGSVRAWPHVVALHSGHGCSAGTLCELIFKKFFNKNYSIMQYFRSKIFVGAPLRRSGEPSRRGVAQILLLVIFVLTDTPLCQSVCNTKLSSLWL